MKNITLKAGNEQDFFRKGKVLARMADTGQPMPQERTVSFDDPADLLRLLTLYPVGRSGFNPTFS